MIYCVEEDDNIRELVIYTLETTGLKAKGFADGAAFMEALAFDTPELVLLDIMLPGDDGMVLLKKLKSSSKTKDIPGRTPTDQNFKNCLEKSAKEKSGG